MIGNNYFPFIKPHHLSLIGWIYDLIDVPQIRANHLVYLGSDCMWCSIVEAQSSLSTMVHAFEKCTNIMHDNGYNTLEPTTRFVSHRMD